jgi:hypothetical protein
MFTWFKLRKLRLEGKKVAHSRTNKSLNFVHWLSWNPAVNGFCGTENKVGFKASERRCLLLESFPGN